MHELPAPGMRRAGARVLQQAPVGRHSAVFNWGGAGGIDGWLDLATHRMHGSGKGLGLGRTPSKGAKEKVIRTDFALLCGHRPPSI